MPEPRSRIIVDGVDLPALFRFPLLVRAASGALHPPRLAWSFAAVSVLAALQWGAGSVFGASAPNVSVPANLDRGLVVFGLDAIAQFAADLARLPSQSPLVAFVVLPVLVAVAAVAGIVPARMAAADLAGGDRATLGDAVALARRGAGSVLGALGVLVALVLASLLPAALLGLLVQVPGLGAAAGLLWPLAVAAAVPAAVLLVTGVFALPLVTAAVAVERCDSLDAAQRAISYVLQRPILVFWWWLVAAVVLVGFGIVLRFTAEIAWSASAAMGSLAGPLPEPGSPAADAAPVAGAGVAFARLLVDLALSAWLFGAGWSAAAGVFVLAREAVEGHDPDELWRPGLVPGTLVPASDRRSATLRDPDDDDLDATRT